MMKQICDFKVNRVIFLSRNGFDLYVESDKPLETIKPGQFANILIPGTQRTFLRRPISICDVDYDERQLRFHIHIVGDGTEKLSTLSRGNILNIIYPLGNSFTTEGIEKPLLIGGGCGIAPLIYLAKKFSANAIIPAVLVGAKTAKDMLHLLDDFHRISQLHIITDDGSWGERGLITDHPMLQNIQRYDRIYVCGPEVMMKAVAKLADTANVPCEVSLENTMACGIGACLCCVTETKDGNRCVCTDGPVFETSELVNFL
jgi:dihydroorotate dehydrogenase electron transfer subunit